MRSTRTFVTGAAVGALVSTLVLIAATALAGTGIGGIFHLGKTNTVNATTKLKGSAEGGMLRITNEGTGAAMNLVVEPGNKPFTTTSNETVDNLSAGFLDGKDSSEFLAVDGKAVDAAHADAADTADTATTAGHATTASQASNADTLDGLDSKAFIKTTLYRRTLLDTDGQELGGGGSQNCPDNALCFARVDCDAGDKALGGGFRDMDNGTRLVGSSPGLDLQNSNPVSFGWVVYWVNNATEDTLDISVLCADIFP